MQTYGMVCTEGVSSSPWDSSLYLLFCASFHLAWLMWHTRTLGLGTGEGRNGDPVSGILGEWFSICNLQPAICMSGMKGAWLLISCGHQVLIHHHLYNTDALGNQMPEGRDKDGKPEWCMWWKVSR